MFTSFLCYYTVLARLCLVSAQLVMTSTQQKLVEESECLTLSCRSAPTTLCSKSSTHCRTLTSICRALSCSFHDCLDASNSASPSSTVISKMGSEQNKRNAINTRPPPQTRQCRAPRVAVPHRSRVACRPQPDTPCVWLGACEEPSREYLVGEGRWGWLSALLVLWSTTSPWPSLQEDGV